MTHALVCAKRLRLRAAVFVLISLVALIADQVTKLWALRALSDDKQIMLIPSLLSLSLVRNPGASLGLGSSMTWLIAMLALVACIAMVFAVLRTSSLLWTLALSFAFAGAFGNLIDRIIYADGFFNGKVIDFINYGWSVGNVADIELMIAGIAVVLLILSNHPLYDAVKQVDSGLNGE